MYGLVLHADIPGFPRKLLQELAVLGAIVRRRGVCCSIPRGRGTAVRDVGRSRLTQREIQSILKALRNLDRKKRNGGRDSATAGEILAEEEEAAFQRDKATDDTRVRTAIACSKKLSCFTREEKSGPGFPVIVACGPTVVEAQEKLAKHPMLED